MRPEDLLPDDHNHVQRAGITVRKGSVGAFLANATILLDADQDPAARNAAERDLLALLPGLHALGLFDVLVPKDAALRQLVEQHR
ncbi:hypothetical protein [Stenotrophomonas rhizophila]|jgi:hypothetical protein|uniref:hypothetical protein n=1 Tax=Stenotrophomonas rhizophila TaxID=216778 RepID=UPI00045680F6|nr:hypothetical protein [Stenotrophomonas rhizophila]AHY57212.1 preprotein translocase subunit SecD [Stenotrophomonas rhizophila]